MKNNDKNTVTGSCCAVCKNSINNCNRNKINKELSLENKLKEENMLAFKKHAI